MKIQSDQYYLLAVDMMRQVHVNLNMQSTNYDFDVMPRIKILNGRRCILYENHDSRRVSNYLPVKFSVTIKDDQLLSILLEYDVHNDIYLQAVYISKTDTYSITVSYLLEEIIDTFKYYFNSVNLSLTSIDSIYKEYRLFIKVDHIDIVFYDGKRLLVTCDHKSTTEHTEHTEHIEHTEHPTVYSIILHRVTNRIALKYDDIINMVK